jgi:vacuolar protein sorting-associated protein 13A/C
VKDPLKARRVWGALDEVFKRFICPTFIDCRVVLQRPNLQVKGWQGFDQYFQIDAAEIVVFNGQRIDDSRLLKKGGISLIKSPHSDGRVEHAWCESYFVEAKELVIEYSDKGIVKGMSAKQNFNLSFERLLHQNEVQEVYPEVEYDRHLRIRSAMTPIVLKAYRDEYLQICRMIFHNFQYDDLMDRILIHDFEVVRSFDPAPISFFLDFAELNIFAMSETQPQPLARITMRPLRLKWIREGTTMNIELDLFSEVCTMFHYVECEDGCIEERGFVGDLKRKVRHRLMGNDDGFHLDRTFYQDVQHDLKQEFTMYEFP